jgi:tRNA G18 (ribose-2'-O)-methylase SpoU
VPFRRFSSGKELLKSLHDASIEVLAFSPRGHEELSRVRPTRPTCVLLGSEEPGLSEELLATLRTVRIPISSSFDSLNVSVACGIALAVLSAAHE